MQELQEISFIELSGKQLDNSLASVIKENNGSEWVCIDFTTA